MKNVTFKTRHALVLSCISLMTCFAMLLGTTFAWFTDSVTSGVNRIVSGNLDVEITHQTAGMSRAENVSSTTKLFTKDMNGDNLLWEPEVMAYETFTVSNEGTLALKYAMTLNNVGYNYVNGTNNWLGDVIQVAVTTTAPADRAAAKALSYSKTLSQFVNSPLTLPTGLGTINAGDNDQEFTIVLYWPQGVRNDNDYNLGHINGVDVKSSDGNPLYVNLGITLVATQVESEFDSFSNTYDASADTADVEDKWAGVAVASAAPTLTATTDNDVTTTTATTTVAAAPTTDTAKQTTVTLTAVSSDTNAAFDASSKLNLKVETNDVKASSSSTAFTVTDEGSTAVASIDLTLTKITTTTSGTEETQLTSGFTSIIDTYVATGMTNPTVKYNGDASLAFGTSNAGTQVSAQNMVDTVGEYWYDSATGHLVFMTDHYSLYYVTTKDVAYIAETDTAYQTLEAAFAAALDGNTITLLRDSAGNGIKAPQDKFGTSGLTVDFGGHTYTIDGTTVGSTGTETNGFQLLKGNKITFKNGSLTSTKAKRLIQNYSNLTLDKMVVSMDNPSYSSAYTVSTNNAKTIIKDSIVNTNAAGAFAFDVDSGWGNYESNEVTVEGNSVINGNVEVAFENKTGGTTSKLTVTGGTFNGKIVEGNNFSSCTVSITGGTFSTNVKDYCAEGYTAVPNSVSNPTSWTVLSAADAPAAKAKAAGATNITKSSNGVVGTMNDGVVYEWRADGSVYVADAAKYNGYYGEDTRDENTYYVGKLVGVTALGAAFNGNPNITKLVITKDLDSTYKALGYNTTIKTIEFAEGTTLVNEKLLWRSAVETVSLPNTIKTIETYAFGEAHKLKSITVPASVTSIGNQAFAYCPELETVTIQGSPAINQYFIGRANTNLTDIYFKGAGTKFTYAKCITFSHTEGGIANGITVHFVNEDLKKAFEEVNSSTEMTLIVDNQA